MYQYIFSINLHDLIIPGISIVEKIIRPVAIYFIMIIGLRIAGKREMAQLNTFDMVVLLSLANAVQNAIIGNDNSLSGGVIGAVTLLTVNHFVVKYLFNHEKLQHFFEGESDVLINNGKLIMNKLKYELITVEELAEAAHKQGIESLSKVKTASLDPNGTISFVEWEPAPEIIRHFELIEKIDKLSKEIKTIKTELEKLHS